MIERHKLEEITAKGDDLEALEALRQKIARTIDDTTSGRDIAALSRQLVGVMTQIAELKAQRDESDPIDEILKGRAFRQFRDSKGRTIYCDPEEAADPDDAVNR